VEFNVNLIVLDSKGIDVILGMDWMIKQKALIDCAKKLVKLVDVSYAAPQAYGIVNVALHRESPVGIIFIFSQGGEVPLSCLRLTQGITQASTTRLYISYVKKT
jgi:hypothetical protein